jgi:Flp pilus assembly pilin Flp
MVRVRTWWTGRWSSEAGATAVEYALIVALIFLAVIAGAMLVGEATNENFESFVLP